MEDKNQILVIESSQGTLFDSLETVKGPYDMYRASYTEARRMLKESAPRVLLLNFEDDPQHMREILTEYHSLYPDSAFVASCTTLEATQLVEFMRLGLSDYLSQPVTHENFEVLMQRIEARYTQKVEVRKKEKHYVISFYSAKGGVGQSLTAINTAVELAHRRSARVLLADFVLQHGNVAEYMDVPAEYNLTEAVRDLDRLDDKLLENSLPKHSQNMWVLPSPRSAEDAELVTPEKTAVMLEAFRDCFQYTFVDVGRDLSGSTLPVLDQSDLIILLTTPDLGSLCSTKRALETFKRLGYAQNKIRLIVNRAQMKDAIDAEAIEKHLEHPVHHNISEDNDTMLRSANEGKPAQSINKRSKVCKNFSEIARALPSNTGKDLLSWRYANV